MKKITFLITLLLSTQMFAELKVEKPTTKQSHSFAIVVDNATFLKVKDAIVAYRNSIEKDGLACYMIIEKDETPETIRNAIIDIYKSEKIFEGIALVGDIPIPMIQDAQHLTSAFKMDQERFSLKRSSIASDRFYDDFDLQFKFLQQDTSDALLYYYTLLADGPQTIEKEIYSGRIKPPVSDDSKYGLIEKYLFRVADQKQKIHRINHMLTFTGHGYHSESLAGWEWDMLSMRELFPQLYHAGNSIKNLNHASSSDMKIRILTEIQKPDIDIALFHAHGSDDTQYLNGYPSAMNTADNIFNVKFYLRSKLRQAKRWKRDPEEYKAEFIKRLDVPDTWFEGTFVDSVIKADSVYNANLDIYASDLEGIKPQPKFIMFDECFNGQFTNEPYIAGEYLFADGKMIVSVANTVNVKQDIWANQFLGMLNAGCRVGEWHKTRDFLESHLIGDPTFHFNKVPKELVDNLYAKYNKRYWKGLLESDDPVYRSLAIYNLFQQEGSAMIDQLVQVYENDPSFTVRMQALDLLAATRSKKFETILFKSAKDPAEMIRRITSILMAKVGHVEYLPLLAEMRLYDHSERVVRQAAESMESIDPDKAWTVFQEAVQKMPAIVDKEELLSRHERKFKRASKNLYVDLIQTMKSDTMNYKAKKRAIRTFKNYNYHIAVDALCQLILDENTDMKLRIMTVETLGWFTFSIDRDKILTSLDQLLQQKSLEQGLKQECIKTKKRLLAGSNDPIVP